MLEELRDKIVTILTDEEACTILGIRDSRQTLATVDAMSIIDTSKVSAENEGVVHAFMCLNEAARLVHKRCRGDFKGK